MAILCPRCRCPASEEAPRCPRCGTYLLDQVVVLVGDRTLGFGARADTGRVAWPGPASQSRGPSDADSPRPPDGPAPSGLFGPLAVGDERIAAQTFVISRIIGLAPDVSEAALDRWWRAHPSGALVDPGYGHLKLGPPVHGPGDGSLCHLSGHLRRPHRWRPVHLQLELTPWSSTRSELSLRPRRRLHNTARYFRAGQATLDRIAADLVKLAAA